MNRFERLFVNLDCPNCRYGMDVELMSIQLQDRIFCPCCKIGIQLNDSDASVDRAQEDIAAAIDNMRWIFE